MAKRKGRKIIKEKERILVKIKKTLGTKKTRRIKKKTRLIKKTKTPSIERCIH